MTTTKKPSLPDRDRDQNKKSGAPKKNNNSEKTKTPRRNVSVKDCDQFILKNGDWDQSAIRIIKTGKEDDNAANYSVLLKDVTEIAGNATNYRNAANKPPYSEHKVYFSLDNSTFVGLPINKTLDILKTCPETKHRDTVIQSLEFMEFEMRTSADREAYAREKTETKKTTPPSKKKAANDAHHNSNNQTSKRKVERESSVVPAGAVFLGCSKLLHTQWDNCLPDDKEQLMDLMRKMGKRAFQKENFTW